MIPAKIGGGSMSVPGYLGRRTAYPCLGAAFRIVFPIPKKIAAAGSQVGAPLRKW